MHTCQCIVTSALTHSDIQCFNQSQELVVEPYGTVDADAEQSLAEQYGVKG